MKKKLKTIGALVLSLSIIFGFSMTAQAASGGVNVNVTKQTLLGTFQYPEAGHRLTIEIRYLEEDPISHNMRQGSEENSVVGNYTSVSESRNVSEGYEYYYGAAVGLVDGKQYAVVGPISPS